MKSALHIVLFVLCSASAFSQGYSGLIGRWPLNGNANDVSGNGLNGIIYGATPTAGYTGTANTAYNFNGLSDYITIPYNGLMNTMQHSICMLVQPLGFNSGICQGNYVLCRGHENGTGFYGLEFFDNAYDNNCNTFYPDYEVFSGGTGTAVTPGPIADILYTPYTVANNWYCVVLTYDGSATRVYINGILKSTVPFTCTYFNTTDSMVLGKSEEPAPFQYFSHVNMGEVRLYNRALTEAEVGMFCDSAESITPTVPQCNTISLPDSLKLCTGSNTTLFPVVSGSDSISGVLWTPAASGLSDYTILYPLLTASVSRWYYITIQPGNPACPVIKDSVYVSAGGTAFVSLGADTTLCTGDQLTLSVDSAVGLWNTGITAASIVVTEPGTYTVFETNDCGNTSDSINVSFIPCNITFPSGFTPNDDGLNDIARAVGSLGLIRDYKLSIFNRWGQRVFYTEDFNAGWDGTFNDVKQEIGSYFYMITYTLEGKNHMLKGDIALIK